jgi:hypothetical protein
MDENTTTPNGDSKSLYSQNVDTGRIITTFFALEERNPEKESVTDDAPGSNTTVKPVEIGELDNGEIGKVGFVGIQIQPLTPEKKNDIKKRAKDSAKAKAEQEAQKTEDKNTNEIDDRN